MTLPASGNPISFSQIDVELGLSSTAQVSLNCTNVRTLFGVASGAIAMSNGYCKSNTTVPAAPTIGTSSGIGSSATSAKVSFTAPTCTGHLSITGYQAISSPGCITATGASSPITVTGLTTGTAYTFKVRAQNSKGYGNYSSSSGSVTPLVTGSAAFTSPGTLTWTAPAGVTSVSVVAVGSGASGHQYNGGNGGASGGGGGLGWKNNISVTPGSTYTVFVGKGDPTYYCSYNNSIANQYVLGNSYANGQTSYFINASTVAGGGGITAGCGGSYVGDGGGQGGQGWSQSLRSPGGGGAGGYTGNGGAGAAPSGSPLNGSAGSGGGGGGGGGSAGAGPQGGGGGGVGIYGQGANGAGSSQTSASFTANSNGKGGSGGGDGGYAMGGTCGYPCKTGFGGNYGGGGGGSRSSNYGINSMYGGCGAVRIVWPGSLRSFPSTCVSTP